LSKLKLLIVFASIFLLTNGLVKSQDSTFILNTGKTEEYFQTYLGNGHFSITSSQLGLLPTESYMIKYYDHAKNDIPRIAALPEWNEINYYDGVGWLNGIDINSEKIIEYTQTLDMWNGLLRTSFTRKDSELRSTKIDVTTFVSRSNKNLAVIRLELTPNFSDMIKLKFPIKERERPNRFDLEILKEAPASEEGKFPKFWYPGFSEIIKIDGSKNDFGGEVSALIQSEGRHTKAAIGLLVFYEPIDKGTEIFVNKESSSADIEIRLNAVKGKKYIFYKLVSVVPQSKKETDLRTEVLNILRDSKKLGYEQLYKNHCESWHELWATDIVIEGDTELQKIIHSMIFYLLGSADRFTEFGIPPMGLSSSGYFGHIFWDSDIYMMPALLLMHPQIAQSLVAFRGKTLPAAINNSDKNNFDGAMYPWESDEIGNETTPFFAYQNALKENHIIGDVAFAQWQYFCATRDTNYLRTTGAEIIRATANFWVSRSSYNNAKNAYEIRDVISVSETGRLVTNETYTNAVAKINLDLAIKVSELFNMDINPKWKEIRDGLFIPFDKDNLFHPSFEGAKQYGNVNVFWSSIVNLLAYPLQVEMNDTVKMNDLKYAVSSLTRNGAGAMMGSNFLPIIAAELEDEDMMNFTIEKTLKGYLRPPFNVLSETHNNVSVNFLTGAGAFLQQVIYGYTGLRITDHGVIPKYKPLLPNGIKKLTLRNFTLNGEKYDIVVSNGKIEKYKK